MLPAKCPDSENVWLSNSGERVVDEKEQIRIQVFKDALIRYSLVTTIGVDLEMDSGLPNPPSNAVKVFNSYEKKAPGLYLDKSAETYSSSKITEFLPRVARGGKNSAHGTFFGDLVFDDGQQIAVAVKPYQYGSNNESALMEYFNTKAVNKIGLYTLQSVGVLLSPNDSKPAYFITELIDSLTTLDTINWSGFFPNTDANPEMVQIWSQVARKLAFLHSLGSSMHCDFAGRNIALNEDDYVFFIDWEKSHISRLAARDSEVSYNFSYTDLAMLMESFVHLPNAKFKAGLGIFCGKDDDWWQGFRDIFLDEYIDTRNRFAETNKNQTQVTEELIALEASLQKDMEFARQSSQI